MTMRDGSVFVGIDLGTSGVRIIAIDRDDCVVAGARGRYPDSGRGRRDPNVWRGAVESAFRSILERVPASDIEAVCVDGTSGTMLAVDGRGDPVREPLMYNDACPDSRILAAIAASAVPESAAHGASSALARAIVLQSAGGTRRLLHQADWISGLLSGRFDRTDENNALKTGYDPVRRRWPDWLPETGVDPGLLPDVVAPGTPVALCEGRLSRRLGLSGATAVVAGTTDGCASFLATGARGIGDGVTALGTTLTVKLFCCRPVFSPEFGVYSHRIPGGWLAGGASNTGGNVIAHFFDAGAIAEHSRSLDPAADTGLDYYPLLSPGERFPHNDPDFPPRMEPRPGSDGTFFQAILEGIAAIERAGFDRLRELGGPGLVSMRTVGGGAANRAWTRMRQARLNVPFRPADSAQAAFGAARLARRGARDGPAP